MFSTNEIIEGLALAAIVAFFIGWLELWQTALILTILVLAILAINFRHLRN